MKKNDVNHSDRELLTIYLKSFKDQLNGLRNSARWKIGHSLINIVEKCIGRKPKSLAIDHLESMIEKTLNRFDDTNNHKAFASSLDQLQVRNTLSQFSHSVNSCAFVVSDINWKEAIQGDVFTALELAEACQQALGWSTTLVDHNSKLELTVDLTISLLFEFDVRALKSTGKKAAWIRSYAEYWLMKPWFSDFDFVLCSSKKILQFIELTCDLPAFYFPIATNPQRFENGQFQNKLNCDYSFSGSRWSEERKIEQFLDPKSIPYRFKIFGRKWDEHQKWNLYYGGQLNYEEIPDLYASSKLILDDANKSTFKWESVNSRVFDALGVGKALITNNVLGVKHTFDSMVPTYSSTEELTNKVLDILQHPNLHQELFRNIQQEILEQHTYKKRAETLGGISEYLYGTKLTIAIKIAVSETYAMESWGDYHFAVSLSKALQAWGHHVRIDIMPHWYDQQDEDSVNIVLHGVHQYNPVAGSKNILWIISHPEQIKLDQLNCYDHIFVASETHASILSGQCTVPVAPLLQCTDPSIFYPDRSDLVNSYNRLYIANSRNQERTAIKYAKELNIPLDVFGQDWENIIPKSWIQDQHVPNALLRFYYSNAGIVINDHWPDMKQHGYISNRIFDVLACNGRLISDDITGLENELMNNIDIYHNADEFQKLCQTDSIDNVKGTENDIADYVARNHSFSNRAATLLSRINQLLKV